MPNYTLTMPCVVISSYTPVSSLWNTKNWLYPAVDYLDTPYINYYAYKIVYGIAGYKYSCIISKGVLVSYERYYIIYNCN